MYLLHRTISSINANSNGTLRPISWSPHQKQKRYLRSLIGITKNMSNKKMFPFGALLSMSYFIMQNNLETCPSSHDDHWEERTLPARLPKGSKKITSKARIHFYLNEKKEYITIGLLGNNVPMPVQHFQLNCLFGVYETGILVPAWNDGGLIALQNPNKHPLHLLYRRLLTMVLPKEKLSTKDQYYSHFTNENNDSSIMLDGPYQVMINPFSTELFISTAHKSEPNGFSWMMDNLFQPAINVTILGPKSRAGLNPP